MCHYSYLLLSIYGQIKLLCTSLTKLNLEYFNGLAFGIFPDLTEGKQKCNPLTVGFCNDPWRKWIQHIQHIYSI